MTWMKISKLVKYFKTIGFMHKPHHNIPSDIKLLIREAYSEKSSSMSLNKFSSYLKPFNISTSTVKSIIKIWEFISNPLSASCWDNYSKSNYSKRYSNSSRKPKILSFSQQQLDFIKQLRQNNPSMGYKSFRNLLLIPDIYSKYFQLFWNQILSYRQFYSIINQLNLPKAQTKRQKINLIRKLKNSHSLDGYLSKMKFSYTSFKALHHWQVDIKYLSDIPNYIQLWLNNIYLYQITFRDFRSWLSLVFYWNNRDKSRVYLAFLVFEFLLKLVWVDPKQVSVQMDWWAEFSNIKINWTKWQLIEYIESHFKWFSIIHQKEQNWHVEAFHNIIEKHFFDTKQVSGLKSTIKSKKDKSIILPMISKYIQQFNKYWYSSYLPRYHTFGMKSPLQIVKESLWDSVRLDLIEKYFTAYDVDCVFNMNRMYEYITLLSCVIYYNEEFVENQDNFTILNASFADFDYFSSLFSTGQIWVDWYILYHYYKKYITYIVTHNSP